MKIASFAALAAAAFAVSGCATIIEGSSQSIAVATPPTTGATCVLSNDLGSWTVTSPGVANVDKSSNPIKATCSKPGWQNGVASVASKFEAWTVADMVTPPVLGIGLDVASGAINKYPNAIDVPMQASSPAPDAAKPASSAN
jgi:hypothetical protein